MKQFIEQVQDFPEDFEIPLDEMAFPSGNFGKRSWKRCMMTCLNIMALICEHYETNFSANAIFKSLNF